MSGCAKCSSNDALAASYMLGVEKGKQSILEDPTVSIIRWTRYDGTKETLPASRMQKGRILYFEDGDKRADVGFPPDFFFKIGDEWAYLPTPERGQSKSRGDA